MLINGQADASGKVIVKSPVAELTASVKGLVSSGGIPAAVHDTALVNGWGLAATSTGPWWTTNEASDMSTLYAGDGRKQVLTVSVPGGPTGTAAVAIAASPLKAAGGRVA